MTRRARRWWHGVEAEAHDPAGTREPWADRPLAAVPLTADQRELLASLADDQPATPHLDDLGTDDDQPAVPHLRQGAPAPVEAAQVTGNGTGKPPGDPDEARPYRRTRWTRREQET